MIALSILTLGMVVKKSLHDQLHSEKAKNASTKIIAEIPCPDPTLYGEVETLIQSGHYEKADNALQKIIQDYPQKKESLLYRAKIYTKQGNMGEAIPLYRKGIEKAPKYLEFASGELWDLVKKGIPKLQREKKLKPNDEKIKDLLADLYFLQRKLGQGCE